MWLPSIQGPRGFVSTPAPGFWARLVFLPLLFLCTGTLPLAHCFRLQILLYARPQAAMFRSQRCRFGDTVNSAKLKKNQRFIDC